MYDAYEIIPDKIDVILFLCLYLSHSSRWNSLYMYSKKAVKIAKNFNHSSTTYVLYNDTD
ncbi:MAG: hypothetical protein Homavirus18_11, partial [Homavirus sp.]